MDNSLTGTLWSKGELLFSALWHPLPVITGFVALLGTLILAAWGLWLPWLGGWAIIFSVITVVRLVDRRVQAIHQGLGSEYISVLDWQQKLNKLMDHSQGAAPEFIGDLRMRLEAIVSRAEELALLHQRLSFTPGLKTLEAKSKRLREQTKGLRDEAARKEIVNTVATQEATCEAVKRARKLRERSKAQLCHMEATLEGLYVQLLALDEGRPTNKMARELDELIADARCLDETKQILDKEEKKEEELLPDEVLRLTAHQALRDGKLDDGEKRLLLKLARMLGLKQEQARLIVSNEASLCRIAAERGGRLNSCELFQSLLKRAHGDGVVSPVERNVLLLTARVLGLSPHQCEQIQQRVLAS